MRPRLLPSQAPTPFPLGDSDRTAHSVTLQLCFPGDSLWVISEAWWGQRGGAQIREPRGEAHRLINQTTPQLASQVPLETEENWF